MPGDNCCVFGVTRCLHARKTFILKILKHVSSKINKFWLNTLRICGDLFDLVHNT